MKKVGIAILVVVGILAICIITCPDAQSHKDSLIQLVTEVWSQHDYDESNAHNSDTSQSTGKASSEFSVGFEYNNPNKDWTIDGGPGMKDEKSWFSTMNYIDNNFQ